MELKIYDKANNLRLTASPNSSSSVTEEIGGECSVSASFTHTEYVPLDVDDYIEVEGVRYKVKSRYRPKQKNTQTYEYSVKFYAPIHDAEDTLMLFQEGGTTSEFSYDGSAREHLQLWIDNMNRRAGAKLWSIGTVIDSGSKTISYRNVKCWDAAFGSNGIASTFDTEMWADGYVINLCKAERGETVELGYLHGLTNLAQEDNGEVKFFTRLFPLGSTRNIDATKYGYSRLQLPDRSLYVDKNVDLYGVKEETEEAAFSTIFPKYVGTVSSVRTEEKISEEGRKYIIYYFKDNDMTWDPKDYEIPDLDYMLQFQTGELAGRGTNGSFQAAWHEDTKEWEIINVYPDETTQIPGGVIVPNPGDQYIPWNFAMPQEYITAAEQEYKQAVNDFLNTYSFDPNKYNGTTDRNYIEKNGTPLRIGWNVRLLSEQYFGSTGGYKNTRIIKVQRKLNDLCQATITCSDEVGSGWKSSVDNSLGSLQDANHNLSQSYEKLHNDMMEGFASIKNLWELKQDDYGNYYIYTKYNIFGRKGITSYVEADVKVPSVFDGLPLDNTTIRKNPETGLIEVIGGTGTSFDENAMWSALSGSSNNQINKSHLTTVLAEYATAESVSALTTELNKKWTQDDTKIKNWDTAFGWGDHSKAGYAHLANEEAFTGLKHFTAGLSVGESKKKIYEENGVVYIDADVAVTGAMTFYASAGRSVSTIMDGVTVDEETITKGSDNVLRIKNAGAGSSFDENAMWSALSGSSDNQINKSHLTNALAGYATESWVTGKGYATESWVASKNYATTEALNAVSNKLNDFLEGSDADTIINKWKELEAFLSGMAETDNLAEILETKADKKYVDSTFVTLATKQTITGEKTFSSVLNTAAIKASGAITAPSLAVSDWVTIAGIKLRKLEDGALMLEGNLALTGGLTTYASDGVSFPSIYDGLPIDNDTIYWQEVDGSKVLKAKEGSGSSFDKSAMWAALEGATTEQINKTHLTTALNGYATESWVTSKNYLTSVSIATISDLHANWDALLKAAPSAYVTRWPTISEVTDRKNLIIKLNGGSTEGTNLFTYNVTGEKTINITPAGIGAAASSHNHSWSNITSGKPSTLSGYGITDAYTKTESDSKYPTKTGSGASGTWGINVTGNAGTATKLQTARTLWGQSFDGTKNVSGDISNVGNINFTLKGRLVSNSSLELSCKNDDTTSLTFTGIVFRPFTSAHNNIDLGASTVRWRDLYIGRNAYVDGITKTGDFYIGGIRLHKTADGVITLEGNLAVTGGITTYAIDPVSASTIMDGVVVDGTTIKKENGKLVAVGGGEAGSVAWGNISGKPSVFATNIANITDLHSSWDAVLAAQKPAWLTAVSIATISDLNSGWDALLKAAPSAYVTRWPTISEVTGKQNLIVKLNGGTTEGTNQFTYNATGAKTINITPAGIGAATSGHTHALSILTDLHSSWDALLKAAPSSYVTRWPSFAEVTSKPSTLSGYGITNAYTKTESDNRYLNVSGGDTIQGLITINHTTLDNSINIVREGSNNPTICFSNKTNGQLGRIGFNNEGKVCVYFKTSSDESYVWHSTNDGAGSGLDADLLDGTHKSGLLTALASSSATNISITVGGTTKSIADLYANSAYKLENTHTIWGQNFNGTQNITGRFTSNERVYADKGIWVTNNDIAGWGQSNAALNLSIPNTSNTSGIICVYRSGQANTGYTRFFSMEISNSSDSVRTYYANEVRIDITPTYMDINKQLNINGNTIIGSGGNLGIGIANPAAKLHVIGDILATGGGTYYGSDIRYKSIIQQVKLSLLEIANAPSFIYRWNKHGMNQNRLNLGGSAQYAQKILPWAVNDNDNFLSMDYATVAYTFAVHTARHLLTYESRTDKKIKKLEREIVILKKQLKKLGYEEVRTLDDSGI